MIAGGDCSIGGSNSTILSTLTTIYLTLSNIKRRSTVKKKLILILALAFVFGFSMSSVQAATVSLAPTTNNVVLGNQAVFQLNFDFSEITAVSLESPPAMVSDLGSGSFDITWNPAHLSFVSFTFDSAFTDPRSSIFDSPNTLNQGISTTPGQLDAFRFNTEAFANADEDSTLPNSGPIGILTFDTLVLGTSLVETAADSTVGFDFGGFFRHNTPTNIPNTGITFESAEVNINAVPIPGSILLLGSGLVGLIGIARRRMS
jgi:hypothetical protein